VASVPLVRMPPGTSTLELLEEVAQGRLDYALVESTRFTLARRFYPQIDVAFNVGKPVDYAWLVAAIDKKPIMEAAKPFFERIRKDGTLKRLVDRYYGHALRMNSIDSGALLDKIPQLLPRLKPFFIEAENASRIQTILEAEHTGQVQGGVFAEAEAGVDERAVAELAGGLGGGVAGDAGDVNRRLAVVGLVQALVGAVEAKVGEVEAEDGVGLVVDGLGLGEFLGEVTAHAEGLCALARAEDVGVG